MSSLSAASLPLEVWREILEYAKMDELKMWRLCTDDRRSNETIMCTESGLPDFVLAFSEHLSSSWGKMGYEESPSLPPHVVFHKETILVGLCDTAARHITERRVFFGLTNESWADAPEYLAWIASRDAHRNFPDVLDFDTPRKHMDVHSNLYGRWWFAP